MMRRREFVSGLGAAAAGPFAAHAQQPTMPEVGFLDSRSPDAMVDRLAGFRQGLKDGGYVEGDNLTIVYRWAENNYDHLPDLAAELVRRRVAVIVATGPPVVAFAAKAATTTIPIIFTAGEDPVRLGLVASLARPGGNLTGVSFLTGELVAKQLALLRELVPTAARVAVLVNPASATTTETTLRDVAPAARTMGLQILIQRASTNLEINSTFEKFAGDRPDALLIGLDGFFASRRVQLVQLAAHHRVPAMYPGREYAEIGGLISYGASIVDAYHQVGVYCGRILKGAKPADLPVVQSSKLELIMNQQTARMLRLIVPATLLATADEVID